MLNFNEATYDLAPQQGVGRTVPCTNYFIDQSEDEWVVAHFVGGEDYEFVYDWFPTQEAAELMRDHLNNTMPPEGYTHIYNVE